MTMAHHRRSPSFTSFSEALSSHKPLAFSQQPKSDIETTHTTKFTANKLQFISNYKLRVESAKNEPGLRHLLGHISIYDAVREWRQAELRASVEMIEASINKLPYTPSTSLSPLHTLHEEETESSASSTSTTATTSQNKRVPRHSRRQSFSDFQAALDQQIDSLRQVRAAHAQLVQMSRDYNDDSCEIEDDDGYENQDADVAVVDDSDSDFESECATESDYDSSEDQFWQEDEEAMSDTESDCSVPEPEHVSRHCLDSTEKALQSRDKDRHSGCGVIGTEAEQVCSV